MASSRWGSAALAVTLLSLLVLSNAASADQELNVASSSEKADGGASANPVLRLPSERSVPAAEQGPNHVDEAVQLSASGIDHQETDGSSTAGTTTLETAEPVTTEIPSLKVSLIPIRRDADGGVRRVHIRGARGVFRFLRPRHHSRLFHQLFLEGRPDGAAPVEIHLGGGKPYRAARMMIRRRGIQRSQPMQMEQEEQGQQQLPRVLTFRIRRLGPHHHGMMHNCAWRKRLEALEDAVQEDKDDEKRRKGFNGLIKQFTVFLNPQPN